jgi:hypothetical protein
MARMTADEIIAKSISGSGQDPKKIRQQMAYLVQKDPKFRVMRSGNTLFSYYNLGNGNVDVAMDTAATPRELVKDVKEFFKAMKIAKFKRGRFVMDNPQIEKVLKMSGIQYKLQPMPSGAMSVIVEA